MFAFVRPIGMTRTTAGGQRSQARIFSPAILTSILSLFASLIKFVFPLIGSIRMTRTATCC